MIGLPTDRVGQPFPAGLRRSAITPGVAQSLAFSATSAASEAFQAKTRVIRLSATAACWVVIGSDPVADDAAGFLIPAGKVEHFAVRGGHKIAAIEATEGVTGSLNIVEAA